MINDLMHLNKQPDLFEPGDESIWLDPHVTGEMLKYHLDPNIEAASRKPETIDETIAWIMERCHLEAGDALLDLGCGPGLYCRRFAERGLRVTGVDMSGNSLDYARQHDPQTTYHQQDYTALQVDGQFKVITLIYGDFCVLSDAGRDAVLDSVRELLLPGGYFVIDVTTPVHNANQPKQSWHVSVDGGFWKPGPFLELMQVFRYPEHDTICTQYLILTDTPDGQRIDRYHVWNHAYTAETITQVLTARGLHVDGIYGDLTGTAYDPNSEWVGVVARNAS